MIVAELSMAFWLNYASVLMPQTQNNAVILANLCRCHQMWRTFMQAPK